MSILQLQVCVLSYPLLKPMNCYRCHHSVCIEYNLGMAMKAILNRLLVRGSWISLINHFQGSTLPPKTDHDPQTINQRLFLLAQLTLSYVTCSRLRLRRAAGSYAIPSFFYDTVGLSVATPGLWCLGKGSGTVVNGAALHIRSRCGGDIVAPNPC